jgi:hypothetical protein
MATMLRISRTCPERQRSVAGFSARTTEKRRDPLHGDRRARVARFFRRIVPALARDGRLEAAASAPSQGSHGGAQYPRVCP